MNAIEIKNLSKFYKDFELQDISLTLPEGCIMGLVGENGAGKSTTIKLILDMIKKDSGEIFIFGKSNKENIKLAKEDIGVVLDEVGISGCLNPIQIGKIMEGTFTNWDNKTYLDYLTKFNLPIKKKFRDFSKGMKMKLGIAVALSHNAKLLILDEATSGLDPVVRDEILDIFCDFTREEKNSILISSHIVSDLEKICDYIAFLHKGKLLICEEKDVLKEEYGIIRTSIDEFNNIPIDAVVGKKQNSFGVEAIVRRKNVKNEEFFPISIEDLFIFMTKGV